MRIRVSSKPSPGRHAALTGSTFLETGYTLAEVMVTVATLGVVVGTLYWPFSAAFCVARAARENLRATQIVMQKAEALRLFTWSQVCDPNHQRKPVFVEWDNPLGVTGDCGGVQYTGYLSPPIPAAGDLPNAGRAHPHAATLTLYWTNFDGAKPIIHARQMQTRLARNGMPKYIWGAL